MNRDHHHFDKTTFFEPWTCLENSGFCFFWFCNSNSFYRARLSALHPTSQPAGPGRWCPPVTRWTSYTLRHRVPFSSPSTTCRAMEPNLLLSNISVWIYSKYVQYVPWYWNLHGTAQSLKWSVICCAAGACPVHQMSIEGFFTAGRVKLTTYYVKSKLIICGAYLRAFLPSQNYVRHRHNFFLNLSKHHILNMSQIYGEVAIVDIQ
jgi:hypothetical protein